MKAKLGLNRSEAMDEGKAVATLKDSILDQLNEFLSRINPK